MVSFVESDSCLHYDAIEVMIFAETSGFTPDEGRLLTQLFEKATSI